VLIAKDHHGEAAALDAEPVAATEALGSSS
jgi:hypothetical protein